jgi:predicted transglutaminase-like cysteine proteinase
MKRNIKSKILAAFISALPIHLLSTTPTEASTLPFAQVGAAPYASILAYNTAYTLTRASSLAGLYDLAGTAYSGLSGTIQRIDLAALQPRQQVSSPETTASIKPDAPVRAAASNDAVFGTVTIPFKRLAALKRFAPSLSEMDSGAAISCSAKGCSDATQVIKAALRQTTQASIRDKLNTVNATVNHAIRYRKDSETYQVADYWATPSETLAHQQGDCEDFAILKMAALKAEGVDMRDMSIVVLFDQKRHFYHAVLSVAVNGTYFILDNMRDQVLPDSRLPDYQPLYSITSGKGFLHGVKAGSKQVASAMPLEKVAPGEGVPY